MKVAMTDTNQISSVKRLINTSPVCLLLVHSGLLAGIDPSVFRDTITDSFVVE